MIARYITLGLITLVTGTGCAGPGKFREERRTLPLVADYPMIDTTATPPEFPDSTRVPQKTVSALTLRTAAERALRNNPELRSSVESVRMAEALTEQAALIPNPEIDVAAEDYSGDLPGVSQSENTFSLSQVLELGGKRAARVRLARSRVTVAQLDLETRRLNILTEVTLRFVDVLAAQGRSTLASEAVQLTEELLSAAEARVRAGAISKVEALRARVAVANARRDSSETAVVLANAKRRLAAMWGSDRVDFDSTVGDLSSVADLPPMESILPLVKQTPDVVRWSELIEQKRAGLAVARSLAVPNLALAAGPRWRSGENTQTFVFGVSMPIPIFHRNQGEIRAARRAIRQAQWDREAVVVRLRTALSVAYASAINALRRAQTSRTVILPDAQQAFQEIRRGYQQGLFDYLDMLAAQQDLIRARKQLLDELALYHRERTRLERLTGTNLENTGGTEDE